MARASTTSPRTWTAGRSSPRRGYRCCPVTTRTPSPRGSSPASTRCWWKPCAGSPADAWRFVNRSFTLTAPRCRRLFSWGQTTALHDVRHMRALVLLLSVLALTLPASARANALEPFFATYEAWYDGKHVGEASMTLDRKEAPSWEVELEIRANRGLLGLARLNVQ